MSTALKIFSCSLLTCVFLWAAKSKALAEDDHPDELCQRLFETYIAHRRLINASTITAAIHIVAERGRNSGFWKTVLKELQKGNEDSETLCVRVLEKMLAIDAAARDAIRREKETGEQGQWLATVNLGSEVVTELLTRGKAADRNRVDAYALALMRARVPEAADFLHSILRDDTGKRYMNEAQFHAAIGLAQLGAPEGFRWLIKNSDDQVGSVQFGLPRWVSNNHLSTCCLAALRDLSGEKTLDNKKACESWWESADKKPSRRSHVRMNDDL